MSRTRAASQGRAELQIGLLNEGHLHASLKSLYATVRSEMEARVDGFVVDVLDEERVTEIQTSSFASIAAKLRKLTSRRPVRLVYPIAVERWLVKLPRSGETGTRRRRSPRRHGFEHVFAELVSFPDLLGDPNFELELVATREEEVRRFADERRTRRRRGWVVVERRLLEIVEGMLLTRPSDLLKLIPAGLPDPFDTADLARTLAQPRWLAQRAAYCLRESGVTRVVGKRRNALVYSASPK